uniref:Putative transporter (inferred by orthology to a C. elegans protein) n=1 Tax=Strongyloides venezuelensis TaxID=75913 RepID=A0A0K0G002_STRVS
MSDQTTLTKVPEPSYLSDIYSDLTTTDITSQLKSEKKEKSFKVGDSGKEKITLQVNIDDDKERKVPQNKTFTVDDAIETLGFGKFQIKMSFLTGLAWMADSMELMILSIISPALECEWGISSMEQAMITTVVFSGMFLSATIWGKICDRYGRKTGLLWSSLFTFTFGALSSLAPNIQVFLLLRGLTGIGVGGLPQCITLYSEFLGSSQRAKCVTLIQSFWGVGACFEAIIAYFVMDSLGWRWLLIISSLPLLVYSFVSVWLPESPRFSISAGKRDEAYTVLKEIAYYNNKKMPEGELIVLKTNNTKTRGSIRNLFIPSLRRTTLLLWFIWTVNTFSYYGNILLTTVFLQLSDECHGGGNKINVSTSTGCRSLDKSDYIDIFTTSFAEFPGLLLVVLVIELIGRKKTMALGLGIFSISTSILYLCLSRPFVTTLFFVARAFISGTIQCVYVYTPEVYPTSLRSIGLGASSGMARLGAIVTPFVAQVVSTYSLYIPVTVYGLCGLLGAIAVLALPIETKGRKMTDSH